MVNLFGCGFIGSHYKSRYECIVNDRNDLTVKSNNILYLISTTDNYNVVTNPYIDIDTNLTTLIRVLENCKHMKDVTFNFASSWFVYGNTTSNEVSETDHCNPSGFYSITKRTAEQLLIDYCKTHNIKWRILRFANVLGSDDRGVSSKKNVLTHMLRCIKNGEPITLYDNGDFYRDYIHVSDLCTAINLVIEKGELNTIYNMGTGISTNFVTAINYIYEKTSSSSNITNVKSTTVQNKFFRMNCDKLKKLGFAPKHDIYSILDELLDEQY